MIEGLRYSPLFGWAALVTASIVIVAAFLLCKNEERKFATLRESACLVGLPLGLIIAIGWIFPVYRIPLYYIAPLIEESIKYYSSRPNNRAYHINIVVVSTFGVWELLLSKSPRVLFQIESINIALFGIAMFYILYIILPLLFHACTAILYTKYKSDGVLIVVVCVAAHILFNVLLGVGVSSYTKWTVILVTVSACIGMTWFLKVEWQNPTVGHKKDRLIVYSIVFISSSIIVSGYFAYASYEALYRLSVNPSDLGIVLLAVLLLAGLNIGFLRRMRRKPQNTIADPDGQ